MGGNCGCFGTGLANAGPTDLVRPDLHQSLQRDTDMNAPTVVNRARAIGQRTTVGLPTERTKGLADRFHLLEESIHYFRTVRMVMQNYFCAEIESTLMREDWVGGMGSNCGCPGTRLVNAGPADFGGTEPPSTVAGRFGYEYSRQSWPCIQPIPGTTRQR